MEYTKCICKIDHVDGVPDTINQCGICASAPMLLEVCKEVIDGHGFNEGNLDLELKTMEIATKSLLKMQQAIEKAEGK